MSQCIDTYLKFDYTFLDSITYPETDYEDFDTELATDAINFLYNRRSFAESSEELSEIGTDISAKLDVIAYSLLPEYLEAKRLTGEHTRHIVSGNEQNYGNQDTENTTFDPVVDSTQAEVKLTGSHATHAQDTSQSETTETEDNVDNVDLKEFYDKMKSAIAVELCPFVNTLFFGGC